MLNWKQKSLKKTRPWLLKLCTNQVKGQHPQIGESLQICMKQLFKSLHSLCSFRKRYSFVSVIFLLKLPKVSMFICTCRSELFQMNSKSTTFGNFIKMSETANYTFSETTHWMQSFKSCFMQASKLYPVWVSWPLISICT